MIRPGDFAVDVDTVTRLNGEEADQKNIGQSVLGKQPEDEVKEAGLSMPAMAYLQARLKFFQQDSLIQLFRFADRSGHERKTYSGFVNVELVSAVAKRKFVVTSNTRRMATVGSTNCFLAGCPKCSDWSS